MTTYDKLTLVYHADGGVLGELAYVWGKLRGTAHCALCDITHGGLRPKPEWERWRAAQGVVIDVVHLNERSAEVAAATDGHSPCVVAHTSEGIVVVLDARELASCQADVSTFAARLAAALAARSLAPDVASIVGANGA